jgi:hypothetical protein
MSILILPGKSVPTVHSVHFKEIGTTLKSFLRALNTKNRDGHLQMSLTLYEQK